MADKTIGELTRATQIQAQDLFVLEQSGTAKSMTGQTFINWLTAYADGHGGVQDFELISTSGRNKTYQFTMADETTYSFTVIDGAKGDTGAQTYVHIKWSAQEPTADNQLSDNPDDWIGIYVGLLSTAPTSYTSYTWYEYKGEKGDTGDSIDSISLVEEGGPGEYNVYSINLDSGDVAGTFRVRNGNNGQGAPGDTDPLMNGTASPGVAVTFARSDHIHPSDTSKADAENVNIATYSSVAQIGLTAGSATIAGAWSVMPNGSLLLCDSSNFASTQIPVSASSVEIAKQGTGSGWIYCHGKDGIDYRMGLNSSNVPDGTWNEHEDFVVLFNASTGVTSGSLSENFHNFTKIKLYFGNTDAGYQNTVEYRPGLTAQTTANIPMVLYFPGTNQVIYHMRRMTIDSNGTTFTTDRPITATLSSSGVSMGTSPDVVIYRVEGFN